MFSVRPLTIPPPLPPDDCEDLQPYLEALTHPSPLLPYTRPPAWEQLSLVEMDRGHLFGNKPHSVTPPVSPSLTH